MKEYYKLQVQCKRPQAQPLELELRDLRFAYTESVEVERERETGFGNHPSGPEITKFTVGLDDRLDFS